MKKFIIFCLIMIITVSLGATVYYFMRDNEELVVDVNPFVYVNKGELVEVNAQIKNPKIGNEVIITSLNQDVLSYNPALSAFTAEKGGAAIIEVKTSNRRIPAVYIEVHVGDGSKEVPFFIDNEEDLSKIGEGDFTLNSHYILMQDISLSTNFTPLFSNSTEGFKGSFNGNGYTISNLYIDSTSESTGLFAQLGQEGSIINLNLENVNIKATMQRAGAVVGYSKGLVSDVNVVGGSIVSTASKVGGAIGEIYEFGMALRIYTDVEVSGKGQNAGGILGSCDSPTSSTKPIEISQCYSKANVTGEKYVGGIIGYARCMTIESCYSMGNVFGNEGVGGLIGFTQHRKDSPVIPNVNNCFVYNSNVTALSTSTTVSSGMVIGSKSTSNEGVNVKNLHYLDVEVSSSKKNDNSFASSITLDKLANQEWLSGTMEFDFRYAWEIQTDAIRPTLIISKEYDSGKEVE